MADYLEYYKLGVIFANKGKYYESLEYYNLSIKLNPNFHSSWYNKGWIYFQFEEYEKAIEACNIALSLEIRIEPIHMTGNAYFNLGQYNQAINFYKKAIEIDDTFYQAYYELGTTYNKLENYEEALKFYNITIKLKPGFSDAYNGKANVLAGLKKYNEAIEFYNEAFKLNSSDALPIYGIGNIYYLKLKNPLEAIKCFDIVTNISPKFGQAWVNKAGAYMG